MAVQIITLHESAQTEFQESYEWYEAQLAGLGQRFSAAVQERLSSLWENPQQGKKVRNEYREVLVDQRYPFLIVFQLRDEGTTLFISATFHTSRNPGGKYRKRR
jgi:plasmid stabilization system protein ParE